jgi:hypothetical protein
MVPGQIAPFRVRWLFPRQTWKQNDWILVDLENPNELPILVLQIYSVVIE